MSKLALRGTGREVVYESSSPDLGPLPEVSEAKAEDNPAHIEDTAVLYTLQTSFQVA
jgi:hypothetical protein